MKRSIESNGKVLHLVTHPQKCLPINREFCERVCTDIMRDGRVAVVVVDEHAIDDSERKRKKCGKRVSMIAVYAEPKNVQSIVSDDCAESIPFVHANVKRPVLGEADTYNYYPIKQMVSTDVLIENKARRCALCGKVFHIGDDGNNYVYSAMKWKWLGEGRHSKCCADCLPFYRHELRMDSRKIKGFEAIIAEYQSRDVDSV